MSPIISLNHCIFYLISRPFSSADRGIFRLGGARFRRRGVRGGRGRSLSGFEGGNWGSAKSGLGGATQGSRGGWRQVARGGGGPGPSGPPSGRERGGSRGGVAGFAVRPRPRSGGSPSRGGTPVGSGGGGDVPRTRRGGRPKTPAPGARLATTLPSLPRTRGAFSTKAEVVDQGAEEGDHHHRGVESPPTIGAPPST
jgi:hypothetical protein